MASVLYKMVLVGLGNVGKSCLSIQFISGRFVPDYDPTLEDSYRKQVEVDGKNCVLDIFDTAGHEDFSAVRDQYMRDGEGFMFVYSITHAVSFKAIRSLYEHALRIKDLDKVPAVLIGNKSDLENEREVSKEQGEELAREFGCQFMETSAKTGKNVTEAFHAMVRAIRSSKKQKKDSKGKTEEKKKNGQCSLL